MCYVIGIVKLNNNYPIYRKTGGYVHNERKVAFNIRL